ncbi:hypothetical protein IE4872_PD00483 (plasmid) [Rhizobium gallicum]|uniref:Uncharacterized protein n=1 Tax=Rhizobium gallicum TaxID=56730 RepID=A0A1L5NSZ1_9HYPH|nr:hypothetical protein IE4872_PD00483 [Rhizobium gallicum]
MPAGQNHLRADARRMAIGRRPSRCIFLRTAFCHLAITWARSRTRRFLVSAAFLYLEEQAFALYIFFTARLACSTSL